MTPEVQADRMWALARHAAALADRYDALASSADPAERRDRHERVAHLRAVVRKAESLRL